MRVPFLVASLCAIASLSALSATAGDVRFVTDGRVNPNAANRVALASAFEPAEPNAFVSAEEDALAPPAAPAAPGCSAEPGSCVDGGLWTDGGCRLCSDCGPCLFCLMQDKWNCFHACLDSLCGCGCDPCCRTWTGRVGMIYLGHSRPDNAVLVREAIPNGQPLINMGDFNLGYRGGPDVSLIRHGTYADVEARYFSIDQWTGQVGPISSANGAAVMFSSPTPSMPITTNVTATYGSELRNFELNLRRNHTERLTWIGGFRMIEVDDNINVWSNVGPGLTTIRSFSDTQNRLYGGQVGLDSILWSNNCLRLEGIGKIGVYGNSRGASVGYVPQVGPQFYQNANDTRVALVGEASLIGVWQVNNCLSLRAGYSAFWIDGLATAASQTANLNPFGGVAYVGGTNSVHGSDTNFYHGATLMLEYAWCTKRR